jgi:hypothetical protein
LVKTAIGGTASGEIMETIELDEFVEIVKRA